MHIHMLSNDHKKPLSTKLVKRMCDFKANFYTKVCNEQNFGTSFDVSNVKTSSTTLLLITEILQL